MFLPEDRNRASFQNVVCHFIAICVFWVFYVYSCYFHFDAVLVWVSVFYAGFVICVCVSVQVCCFMVGFLVIWGFLVLGVINFGLWDTRRWIKSKNMLQLMLIHHYQKPTEVIYGNFLFTTMSRLALGPTQLPIQWVWGAVTLWVKWP